MDTEAQRLDVARVLKETFYVSSVQVLRVVTLVDSHCKSYAFSLRPYQFSATKLCFPSVVSLQRCQDDLRVLTLVCDAEALLVLKLKFPEGKAFQWHITHLGYVSTLPN